MYTLKFHQHGIFQYFKNRLHKYYVRNTPKVLKYIRVYRILRTYGNVDSFISAILDRKKKVNMYF